MKEVPGFNRFNELNKSNIRYDYHIHTSQTDGSSTIEEYINSAIVLGLKEIAFTEHVRRSSVWFDSFLNEVKSLRLKFQDKLRVFTGMEAKVLDFEGNIDASGEMISNSEIVIGSVHRYPNGKNRYLDYLDLSVEDAAEIEFNLACSLLKNPYVDVLGHPGGVFETQFNMSFPDKFYEDIIKKANECDKVIEINCKYLRNPDNFFKFCKKYNPYVSLGSDAHNMMELGNIFKLINVYLDRSNRN